MGSQRSIFLVLFLSLPPLYCAQSDVSTAGLVAVLSIGGGTVIIVCLVWLVICYNLYKTERDFCKFRKHLRLDRYQQQERRRQRTVNRSFKMQRLSATHQTTHPLASSDVSPSMPTRLMEQPNVLLQPAQNNNMARSPLPTSENTTETAMINEQTPSAMSSSSRECIARSNTDQQLSSTNESINDGRNYKTKSVRFSKSSSTSKIEGQKRTRYNDTQHIQQQQQHDIHHETQHSEQDHNITDYGNPSDQQQIIRSSGIQKVVLGHYSPKFLREDEEVDVILDTDSSPPRYSWLFSDKKRMNSQTRHATRTGGRKGERNDAMRAYGQLTTWPQRL